MTKQQILDVMEECMTSSNPFIASTAKDYDMSYESVEVYYNRYGSTAMFYEELEKHIKQRSF